MNNLYIDKIPIEEWLALKTFYLSTNGNDWDYKDLKTNTTHWNFTHYSSNNPCYDKWAGIICTCYHHPQIHYYSSYFTYYYSPTNPSTSGCNIQKIVLHKYNLSGTIPSQIGVFRNLTSLLLPKNNIYGTIPIKLNNLKQLRELNFIQNRLTGTIPDLSGLVELETLLLQYNQLDGTIPSSLAVVGN